MNTNELADLLSEGVVGYKLQFEAADMLRTIPALQAEIESLKAHPIKLTDEEINKIADMFGINKYSLKMATLAILRKACDK